MGDSAYDDKRIENTIKDKKWSFVMSLKKKRSVKSEHVFNFKPKSHGWCGVDIFFKNHRRLKWQTIRVKPNGVKKNDWNIVSDILSDTFDMLEKLD